jgi:hypothetical protein
MTDEELLKLVQKHAAPSCPTAQMPLQPSQRGGSGTFLVRADDGRRYWCKPENNGQSPRVPINEQIVGRLGKLLSVAVCESSLVKIPPELTTWEFRPGRKCVVGYCHGSLALENVTEHRDLAAFKGQDDNARRLSGLSVLADWCGAQDHQWLTVHTEDSQCYSHDHGHYFPGGPDWTPQSLKGTLLNNVDGRAIPLLHKEEALAVAAKLDALSERDIVLAAGGLPVAWQVTEQELVAMVRFLLERRPVVVRRIRAEVES